MKGPLRRESAYSVRRGAGGNDGGPGQDTMRYDALASR